MKTLRVGALVLFWAAAVVLPASGQPPNMEGGASTAGRHIPLEGQPNFRDLGGHRTADGGRVKPGLIYRSGDLSRLSDEDVSTLERLGIKTVVDFRSAVQDKQPDRLPNGARHVALDINPAGLALVLRQAFDSLDFSNLPDNFLERANRALIGEATTQYGRLFEIVIDPANLPLVFHCTYGKDRSGVAAALVLMALGVPAETARQDYLLSNVFRREENEKRLAGLRQAVATQRGMEASAVDLSPVEGMFYLESTHFDAMLDEISERQGSFDEYLRVALGISEAQRTSLRDQLVE